LKSKNIFFESLLISRKATSTSDHKIGIAGQEFATISAKDLTETNNQDPSHSSSESVEFQLLFITYLLYFVLFVVVFVVIDSRDRQRFLESESEARTGA
jgi:hypothetical protein